MSVQHPDHSVTVTAPRREAAGGYSFQGSLVRFVHVQKALNAGCGVFSAPAGNRNQDPALADEGSRSLPRTAN